MLDGILHSLDIKQNDLLMKENFVCAALMCKIRIDFCVQQKVDYNSVYCGGVAWGRGKLKNLGEREKVVV